MKAAFDPGGPANAGETALQRLRACLKRVLRSAWLHDSPRQLQLMR